MSSFATTLRAIERRPSRVLISHEITFKIFFPPRPTEFARRQQGAQVAILVRGTRLASCVCPRVVLEVTNWKAIVIEWLDDGRNNDIDVIEQFVLLVAQLVVAVQRAIANRSVHGAPSACVPTVIRYRVF